jgi:hypothetical protein
MNARFVRFVCRVLAASMFLLPLQSQAGLIGTGEVAATAQPPQGARAALVDRMQEYGVSREFAAERVAALSDSEVAQLAGEIDRLPAGANSLLMVVVIALLIYFLIAKPSMEGKPAAKK